MTHGNPSEVPRGPLGRLFDRVINRLFADEDAHALAKGWEITRLPHGGRRYRDPRWDSIRCCEVCGGSGMAPDAWVECDRCAGTGVLRTAPSTARTEIRR
jgi:hypothetical protein